MEVQERVSELKLIRQQKEHDAPMYGGKQGGNLHHLLIVIISLPANIFIVCIMYSSHNNRAKNNEEFEAKLTSKLKELMFDCDLDSITSMEV